MQSGNETHKRKVGEADVEQRGGVCFQQMCFIFRPSEPRLTFESAVVNQRLAFPASVIVISFSLTRPAEEEFRKPGFTQNTFCCRAFAVITKGRCGMNRAGRVWIWGGSNYMWVFVGMSVHPSSLPSCIWELEAVFFTAQMMTACKRVKVEEKEK